MKLFSELRQVYFEALNNKKISYSEFNFIGSRGSGKTFPSMDFVIKFFVMDKNNIIYIFRENYSDLENFKQELIPKLEALGFRVKSGIGGNYNAKLNQISNGYNKIIFKTLNAEKMDITKGKGAGLPVWKDAHNIVCFFEECTQMEKPLVDITLQGIRGNIFTNVITIYCANPWSPLNWYVKKCNGFLPENLYELTTNGYQKITTYDDSRKKNIVVVRNNIYTNPHLSNELKNEYESYKELNYNMWLICCIGMSGIVGDMIYATNMNKMKEVNYNVVSNDEGFFQGGVDWGDGSSIGASPTTAHFGKIHFVLGVDIIREKTIWNNQGNKLQTNEQIDKVIEFYKDCLLEFKKPFKVYIDNASLSDFYEMFNARLSLHGLDYTMIEFLPTHKTPITMRIDVINVMISSGLFRVDRMHCKDLINALNNAHWVEKKITNEDTKRYRNHAETHWINSGCEYILDKDIYAFKTKWNTIFEKIKYN